MPTPLISPLKTPAPLQRLAQVLQAVEFDVVLIPSSQEQPFEQLLVSSDLEGPLGAHPIVLLFQDQAISALATQAGIELEADPVRFLLFQTHLALDLPEGEKTWLPLALNLINQWLPLGQLQLDPQAQVNLRYTLMTRLEKQHELVVIDVLGQLSFLAHRCWNWLEQTAQGELNYTTLSAELFGKQGGQLA